MRIPPRYKIPPLDRRETLQGILLLMPEYMPMYAQMGRAERKRYCKSHLKLHDRFTMLRAGTNRLCNLRRLLVTQPPAKSVNPPPSLDDHPKALAF